MMLGLITTKSYRYHHRYLFACALVLLTGTPSLPTARPAPLRVFVSIAPQAFFARAVGGASVDVEVLLPSGQSPATYEPTPQQMGRLTDADVYFAIGVPFEERLLEKLGGTLKHLKIVSTIDGIALRPISGHSHGSGSENHGGRPDPHTWLAPALVKIQARNMCNALCQLNPADSLLYERNRDAFAFSLDSIDTAIKTLLSPLRGRTIRVFHPAYGYFTDAYGLRETPIELHGKEPSARQLAAIIEEAKIEGVRTLFVQPQFSRKQAQTIAGEINGRVVPLDPLSGDYLDNLWHIAGEIAKALRAEDVDDH